MRSGASLDSIQTVSGSDFDAMVLRSEGPIAVEFMSYACGHCGALEPVLQRAAAEVRADEKVFRVNVAAEPELAASYEIQGTPTLIMFLGGKEVGRVAGPDPTAASVLDAITQPFAH